MDLSIRTSSLAIDLPQVTIHVFEIRSLREPRIGRSLLFLEAQLHCPATICANIENLQSREPDHWGFSVPARHTASDTTTQVDLIAVTGFEHVEVLVFWRFLSELPSFDDVASLPRIDFQYIETVSEGVLVPICRCRYAEVGFAPGYGVVAVPEGAFDWGYWGICTANALSIDGVVDEVDAVS